MLWLDKDLCYNGLRNKLGPNIHVAYHLLFQVGRSMLITHLVTVVMTAKAASDWLNRLVQYI